MIGKSLSLQVSVPLFSDQRFPHLSPLLVHFSASSDIIEHGLHRAIQCGRFRVIKRRFSCICTCVVARLLLTSKRTDRVYRLVLYTRDIVIEDRERSESFC
jgi:hypothetical protein